MDDEQVRRLAAKKFAIGYNTGRKRERERQAKVRKRAYKAGQKAERKRRAQTDLWRKKWDWKHRVFSVRTVITIAGSVVAIKVIDLAAMYFGH
jgi:hypothetical protein